MSDDETPAQEWLREHRASPQLAPVIFWRPITEEGLERVVPSPNWNVRPIVAGKKERVMPTINIPAPVRFGLYIASALGSVFVIYAIQKGWAGDAENQLWLGISGLLAALAASKTPISTSDDEAGDIGVLEAVVIVFVVVVILVLLGALR